MFSFQQSCDEQISDNPYQQDHIIMEDLIWEDLILPDDGSNYNMPTNFFVGEEAQQQLQQLHEKAPHLPSKYPSINENAKTSCSDARELRKIIRKEIERQRRQQISILNASLRSVLPIELIKGKRSVSDHLTEAVNHIKNLKNNIRELSLKRDQYLKRMSNSSNDQASSSDNMLNFVTVRAQLDGLEIVIRDTLGEHEGFLLSRVLKAVLEEGFEVETCVFTKNDSTSYTTIHCQSCNQSPIDQAGLEQKLNNVMLSSKYDRD